MFNKCQGEAGDRNLGMGSVQIGSTQGQADVTQRNLRRQLGVERGFRYMLGVFLHMIVEIFLQLYFQFCAQPSLCEVLYLCVVSV